MTKAPVREANFRTSIRRSSDIVIPSGNWWAGVRYIPFGRSHARTPAETDSPCSSTGTGTTFAPALEKAIVAPTYAGSSPHGVVPSQQQARQEVERLLHPRDNE